VLWIIITRAAVSLGLGPREHSERSESCLSCYTTVKRKKVSVHSRPELIKEAEAKAKTKVAGERRAKKEVERLSVTGKIGKKTE